MNNFCFQYPFNASKTTEFPFYRENGELLGKVPMMQQLNYFPWSTIVALDATVVELPYGKDDSTIAMILIYPRINTTLNAVFHNLREFSVERLHYELHKNEDELGEVTLTVPKFTIDTDIELRQFLEQMGIIDIFDPSRARLSKISKQPVHVNRVFHKAAIEMDEAGTVAAAATGAQVTDFSFPPEFIFHRPFGFLVTERSTNTLLFAGQIRNPLL